MGSSIVSYYSWSSRPTERATQTWDLHIWNKLTKKHKKNKKTKERRKIHLNLSVVTNKQNKSNKIMFSVFVEWMFVRRTLYGHWTCYMNSNWIWSMLNKLSTDGSEWTQFRCRFDLKIILDRSFLWHFEHFCFHFQFIHHKYYKKLSVWTF